MRRATIKTLISLVIITAISLSVFTHSYAEAEPNNSLDIVETTTETLEESTAEETTCDSQTEAVSESYVDASSKVTETTKPFAVKDEAEKTNKAKEFTTTSSKPTQKEDKPTPTTEPSTSVPVVRVFTVRGVVVDATASSASDAVVSYVKNILNNVPEYCFNTRVRHIY